MIGIRCSILFWQMAVLTLVSVVGQPVRGQSGTLSRSEMEEDLARLEILLTELHPAISTEADIHRLIHALDEIRQELPEALEPEAFLQELSRLVVSLECGHTMLFPRQYAPEAVSGLFPVALDRVGGRIVLAHHYKLGSRTLKRGGIVTSINGLPMEQILDELTHYLGGADHFNPEILKDFAVGRFPERYRARYGAHDQFQLGYKAVPDSSPQLVRLTIDSLQRLSPEPEPVDLTIDALQTVAVLKIRSFKKSGRFTRELDEAFREIAEKKIGKLVLDLRDNPGGAFLHSERLLKYLFPENFRVFRQVDAVNLRSTYRELGPRANLQTLLELGWIKGYKFKSLRRLSRPIKPIKDNNFSGSLLVLINSRTFSAASIVAAILKSSGRARLVGTVSGGGFYQTYGGHYHFAELQHSGIRVRLPTMAFQLAVTDSLQAPGTNLAPQVIIERDYSTFVGNEDVQLEKCLQLFNQEEKQN